MQPKPGPIGIVEGDLWPERPRTHPVRRPASAAEMLSDHPRPDAQGGRITTLADPSPPCPPLPMSPAASWDRGAPSRANAPGRVGDLIRRAPYPIVPKAQAGSGVDRRTRRDGRKASHPFDCDRGRQARARESWKIGGEGTETVCSHAQGSHRVVLGPWSESDPGNPRSGPSRSAGPGPRNPMTYTRQVSLRRAAASRSPKNGQHGDSANLTSQPQCCRKLRIADPFGGMLHSILARISIPATGQIYGLRPARGKRLPNGDGNTTGSG